MKSKIISILAIVFLMISCSKEKETENCNPKNNGSKVLMLKVDYVTNKFEEGKEFIFSDSSSTFTISKDYKSPSDFGYLKYNFQELSEPLFDGTIVWMGLGEINFPKDLLPQDKFKRVETNDYVTPKSGFENIFDSPNPYDFNVPWLSVQSLVKVREYLKSNPNASVKIFLYMPSVGSGDPLDWDYIIFMKK